MNSTVLLNRTGPTRPGLWQQTHYIITAETHQNINFLLKIGDAGGYLIYYLIITIINYKTLRVIQLKSKYSFVSLIHLLHVAKDAGECLPEVLHGVLGVLADSGLVRLLLAALTLEGPWWEVGLSARTWGTAHCARLRCYKKK